jgi:hypothetical protein
MLIRGITLACSLLTLFLRYEAFPSFSCWRISFARERFILRVGTSPDGTPDRNKLRKPHAPADGNAGAKNDFEDEYKRKTVVQLRVLLKDKGLKVSGLKNQLIERLKQSNNAACVLQATNYDARSVAYKSTLTAIQ